MDATCQLLYDLTTATQKIAYITFSSRLVLPENHDVRYLVGKTNCLQDLRKAVNILRERFVQYHEGRELWTQCGNSYSEC